MLKNEKLDFRGDFFAKLDIVGAAVHPYLNFLSALQIERIT